MRISQEINKICFLWWKWTKLFPKTKTGIFSIRKKYCKSCEKINEDLSKIVRRIDEVFNVVL